MKKTEYVIEYKIKGELKYRPSSRPGWDTKQDAMSFAANKISGEIESIRIVEQTRKVVKVYRQNISEHSKPPWNHGKIEFKLEEVL